MVVFVFSLIDKEAHVDALSDLRFTLAFVHCIMELASSKDPELEACSPDISFLQKSLVTDQISLLSREWRWETWGFEYFHPRCHSLSDIFLIQT